MTNSNSRSLYILIGIALLAVFGFRILPRIVGSLFGGLSGPLYLLSFALGAIGIVVLGVRWLWLRR